MEENYLESPCDDCASGYGPWCNDCPYNDA